MEIQSERNQQSKEIEQFRTDHKKLFADMNRKINDGKIYHEKLTKEVTIIVGRFCSPFLIIPYSCNHWLAKIKVTAVKFKLCVVLMLDIDCR